MTPDSIPLDRLPLALRARLALESALTGLSPAEILADALAAHLRPAPPARQTKARRAAS